MPAPGPRVDQRNNSGGRKHGVRGLRVWHHRVHGPEDHPGLAERPGLNLRVLDARQALLEVRVHEGRDVAHEVVNPFGLHEPADLIIDADVCNYRLMLQHCQALQDYHYIIQGVCELSRLAHRCLLLSGQCRQKSQEQAEFSKNVQVFTVFSEIQLLDA